MKKKLLSLIIGVSMFASMTTCIVGCQRESERVSYNVSKEADNFKVLRRLAIINSRTDKVEFELVGVFSIDVDKEDNQLEVTAKMKDGTFKKHFIGLNDETMYVIEDIGGAKVNKYRYEINYIPEMIIPFDVRTDNK